MKHHRETEIKLPAGDWGALRKGLSRLGFKVLKPRHFERNWLFDFGDLRLRRSQSLLRLRLAGGAACLTFKGPPLPSARHKIRREIETHVEDGALLFEILKSLGLKPVFIYEKYRTVYSERGNAGPGLPQVAYDQTPVGDYLELEGPGKWIDQVASGLGYSPRDYITSSYVALYLEKCRTEGQKPSNMVFGRGRSRPAL